VTLATTWIRDARRKARQRKDARRLVRDLRSKLKKHLDVAEKAVTPDTVRSLEKMIRATVSAAEWSKAPLYEAAPSNRVGGSGRRRSAAQLHGIRAFRRRRGQLARLARLD
jgi:hypothetical protein